MLAGGEQLQRGLVTQQRVSQLVIISPSPRLALSHPLQDCLAVWRRRRPPASKHRIFDNLKFEFRPCANHKLQGASIAVPGSN